MPGAVGGAAVLDAADEHAVALGQADRAAQPARDARRRDRDAEPERLGSLAAAERLDAARAAPRRPRIARIRPPSTRTALMPEQPSVDVDQRTAGRIRAAAARCARSRPRSRRPRGPRKLRAVDETKPGVTRRPRPPGLASASTARPMLGVSSSAQSTGATSPVSTSITARSRSGSAPATRPRLAAAVGERDRRLVVAEVVGVGEHAPGCRSRRRSPRPSRVRGRRPAGPTPCGRL